jgi:seryl-tRNA synthetase
MIDLLLLRNEPEKVLAALAKKDPHFNGERLKELDEQVRSLNFEVEALRAQKNRLAAQAKSGVTEALREQSLKISAELKAREVALKDIEQKFNELYLYCPNIVYDDVPVGGKESNMLVKTVGTQPKHDFPLKHHLDLGKALQWIDFEAGARLAGAQFAVYKGDGVRLMYSLMMLMLNNNMKHGYDPILPPYLVNEKSLEGSGNFPRFKDEVYGMAHDDLYLIPTAEVSLTNLYRDHIFLAEELPIRMTSWTSCFRREAGGYGATERGLIRMHEFEKAELYTITEPENSQQELDRMIACAESILQQLGLHYRIMLLAAQDCSFQSAKTYDIEVWMPAQQKYQEVSSASNCRDFQARRCAIRYRKHSSDKTHLVYTLNASSLALPRLMVALMETYQQADGSLQLPDVLKAVTISL